MTRGRQGFLLTCRLRCSSSSSWRLTRRDSAPAPLELHTISASRRARSEDRRRSPGHGRQLRFPPPSGYGVEQFYRAPISLLAPQLISVPVNQGPRCKCLRAGR
ncbi:hypothetical protein NDU88_008916 [Pleurodeles waltl]|uniref:Uncharacterized protein n=1 Tax=Pleurodeles waltl TaxID=8319 RepID=A0AAV7QPZ9_PLEWA|nr:hypothetical protein NDU88_008916 [Pleurodeles waltl]